MITTTIEGSDHKAVITGRAIMINHDTLKTLGFPDDEILSISIVAEPNIKLTLTGSGDILGDK